MLSTAKHLAAAKVNALSNTLWLAPIHRINRDRVLIWAITTVSTRTRCHSITKIIVNDRTEKMLPYLLTELLQNPYSNKGFAKVHF